MKNSYPQKGYYIYTGELSRTKNNDRKFRGETVQREWPIYNQSSEPISVKNPGSFYTFMFCWYYIQTYA